MSSDGTCAGVAVEATELDLDTTTFASLLATTAGESGAAVHVVNGLESVALSDVTFEDVDGQQTVLVVRGGVPSFESLAFSSSGEEEALLGFVFIAGVSSLVAHDLSFDASGAAASLQVGLAVLEAESIELSDLAFSSLDLPSGAIRLDTFDDGAVERVWLDEVDADSLLVVDGESGDLQIDNVVVCSSEPTAGVLLEVGTGATEALGLTLRHVTYVDAAGTFVEPGDASVLVQDSLILGSPSFVQSVAYEAVGTDHTGAGSLVEQMDPGLGVQEQQECSLVMLQPSPSGPAWDAGVGDADRDGSVSDLGATGGPAAWTLGPGDDGDGDGVGWYHDCDDDDESVVWCDTSDAAQQVRWVARTCSVAPGSGGFSVLVVLSIARRRRRRGFVSSHAPPASHGPGARGR